MKIEEIEKDIIEEFSNFDDWMDKYNYIIDLGKTLPQMDTKYKTISNLIDGCQSQVWLHAEMEDNKIIFRADSDAIITKGIVYLLIRALTNQSPDDILEAKL
jgi:cysteine desulfuration protein SufE